MQSNEEPIGCTVWGVRLATCEFNFFKFFNMKRTVLGKVLINMEECNLEAESVGHLHGALIL